MLSVPVLEGPPPRGVAVTPAGKEIVSGPAAAAWMTRRLPSVITTSPVVLQIWTPAICNRARNTFGFGEKPAPAGLSKSLLR